MNQTAATTPTMIKDHKYRFRSFDLWKAVVRRENGLTGCQPLPYTDEQLEQMFNQGVSPYTLIAKKH